MWPDGREDDIPACCYEQGVPIDHVLEPFERVEWLPGLTVTDDSLDATMTPHKVADDVYVLVFGRTDERDGSIEPFPLYETVAITAIRGDRDSAIAAWNTRIQQWVEDQEIDQVGEREVALLGWVVAHGLDDEGTITYRDYLSENRTVEADDLLNMIRELEELGFLYTFGGGIDAQPAPTTKANLPMETLQTEGPAHEQ